MTLGVILNMTSFGLATLGLIGVVMLASAFHRAPTRPCHQCGRRVALHRRVCRDCGYEFAPVRFTR
jgi:predicted amidophosphoribosyltransferase